MRTHLTVVLFLVAAGLSFYAVGEFADRYLGVKRFPERTLSYTVAQLRELSANPGAARRYVVPVLIPLDLFVMILLGGSMAVASLVWVRSTGVPAEAFWIVLLLPIGYVAVDLAEDSFLAVMLSDPGNISDAAVTILKGLTVGKLVFVTAAFVQTLVLAVIAAYKGFAASM